MKKFPTLYKKTTSGKTQIWDIAVEGSTIIERYGQKGGKIQERKDTVKVGKNIGKKNETTPAEQAEAEALAKWTKKAEKDYRENESEISKARTISYFGGLFPMLAHKYKDNKSKVIFPCYVQPKLDGIRCIASYKGDKIQLWFRSGKEVTTMDHLKKELLSVMDKGDIVDGELYIHNDDFNRIGGCIRRDVNVKPEDAKKIEYHIYDYPIFWRDEVLQKTAPFNLRKLRMRAASFQGCSHLKVVDTFEIKSEEEMFKYFQEFVSNGYEGIMIRNANGLYQSNVRSYDLLKYKEFEEDEFEICGYSEGRGIYQNAVGDFTCKMKNGKTFGCKLKGKGVVELMKEYFKKPELFMHKQLTVIYQGVSEDGVPRFPVGKSLRWDK